MICGTPEHRTRMTISLSLESTDDDLRFFAQKWAERLAAEQYAEAFVMLMHRRDHPAKSWCSSAEDLRAWIEGYGTDDPDPDEVRHKVSALESAMGDAPIQRVIRGSSPYPGFVARLDYWLPMDGEWSDLMASIDFVAADGQLVPVSTALRVP